jgi:hypothetical protein
LGCAKTWAGHRQADLQVQVCRPWVLLLPKGRLRRRMSPHADLIKQPFMATAASELSRRSVQKSGEYRWAIASW